MSDVREVERLVVVLCVPLLIAIGYQLFKLGVTGDMKIVADVQKWSGSISAVAPGSFCFLLGVSLGAYVMFRGVTSTTTTSTPGGSVVTTTESGLGGGGLGIPLSIRLRAALGDLYLCEQANPNDTQPCFDKYSKLFKLQPTLHDLAVIQEIETAQAREDAGANEKYKNVLAAYQQPVERSR
jgi:hypothetical protein